MKKAADDKMAIAKAQQQQAQEQRPQKPIYEEEVKEMDSDDSFDDDMDAEEMELLRKMKEERLSEFEHMNMERRKKAKRSQEGVGEYRQINEEEFMKFTTTKKYIVCHFSHQDFFRCKIVDKHMRMVAFRHPECHFFYLDVQKAPFIVEKLKIQVLPTIGIFIDGILIESITGFEEFGGRDDFKTVAMTRRLATTKVIKLRDDEKFKMNTKGKKKIIYGADSEDSDSDY